MRLGAACTRRLRARSAGLRPGPNLTKTQTRRTGGRRSAACDCRFARFPPCRHFAKPYPQRTD